MKKISILVAIALMAIIYSCGNGENGSNEQKADSLSATKIDQKQVEPQITLTVKSGELIKLGFSADAENTQLKIVSGKRDTSFMIGTDFMEIKYLSGDNTMTIYGNITTFDCSFNDTNLSSVDFSKNTILKDLSCSNNPNLKVLDVSKNPHLERIEFSYTKLGSLDLSNNKKVKYISCVNVPLDKDGLTNLPDRKGLEQGMLEYGCPEKSPKIDDEQIKKNWIGIIPSEVRRPNF